MDFKDLKCGDLIAFQIGEQPDFSAPNKDSWGVLKVLDLGKGARASISVSVKSGLWAKKPTKWQAFGSSVLIEERFKGQKGKYQGGPLIFSTLSDDMQDLLNPECIGREFWFRSVEQEALRQIRRDGPSMLRFSFLDFAPRTLDHEHRAKFDQERWLTEIEASRARTERLHQERLQREKLRLKNISLPVLLAETQFKDWDDRTQIVPKAFTSAVREQSQSVINQLLALGEKPKRKDVRGILKAYVGWLNNFDGSFGYAIETEEREELVGFVEELCWATKQKPLIDEMDALRDW